MRAPTCTDATCLRVMDAALAGVLGAGIGAVAGIAGSVVTNSFAARRERDLWRRTQMADAYANALSHLARATTRRSKLTTHADGTVSAIMSEEDLAAWFLDIADAEKSVAVAAGFASVQARLKLVEALSALHRVSRRAVEDFVVPEDLWQIQGVVSSCAVDDLGGSRPR